MLYLKPLKMESFVPVNSQGNNFNEHLKVISIQKLTPKLQQRLFCSLSMFFPE